LDKNEEAIGILRDISGSDSYVTVTLETVRLVFSLDSNEQAKKEARLLAPLVGKQVGILRDGDSTIPMRIGAGIWCVRELKG
jgi:hypothetical protein